MRWNASDSTDPDGTVVAFAWDFGDGTTAEGEVVEHSFEQPGEYEVVLTVTDDDGATATATRKVSVTEPPAKPVSLPVRVLSAGDARTTSVEFDLGSAAGADTLYMQCHRCTYRDVSTTPERGAKASVRLNDGPWVDITDDTVALLAHEADFGGLNGALYTTRFTLPLEGAVDGRNRLDFRFNGTDGFTSGYRVLAFNLRSAGRDLLDGRAFTVDDPADWAAMRTAEADIARGEALWRGDVPLRESPLSTGLLRASCSSCHAQDGRDLKYFAFSDESVVLRSEFHGLNRDQGEQIASYIRSLDVDVPANGRPWNPPYQPGPGLDAKPADEWSAGAGLEWVLERDIDMLDHLLPKGTGAASVAEVFDVDATMNAREMPIALQFPDWNAWLPEIHPLDNWGDEFGTRDISGRPLSEHYAALRSLVEDNDIDTIVADGRYKAEFNRFAAATSHLGSHQGNAFRASGREARQDDGAGVSRSLVHWSAVKQWEVQQEFGLDGRAREDGMYGPEFGEARSWVSQRRNVFDMAPHRTAPNNSFFDFQTQLVGKVRSTQWYQLQVVLNAGAREGYNLGPTDWNYQPNHIFDLARFDGPAQPVRYAASHAKMHQYMYDGSVPGARGSTFGLRQVMPSRHLPDNSYWNGPDMTAGIRSALLSGMHGMLAASLESRDLDAWPRGDNASGNALGPLELTAETIPRDRVGRVCHAGNHDRCYYTAIPYLRDAGVTDEVLDRLIAWGEAAWPAGDWDALKTP